MHKYADKCAICNGESTHEVEFTDKCGKDHSLCFCSTHLPNYNTASEVRQWIIRPLFVRLSYNATLPLKRNPLATVRAGFHVPPKLTTTMRYAMIRLMKDHGFFNAARILTLGANEEDRYEVMALAADLDREFGNK